jgi:membrane-associated phospholipid phosphatase
MLYGSANRIDDVILRWLTSLVGRSATFDNTIEILSHGGETRSALIMSIFWWYWFRQTDGATTQRTREHLLATMFAALVGLFAARILALTLPFRLRPRFDPALHLVFPDAPASLLFVDWSAFPSDHAVMFSALAAGLCFLSWRVGLAVLCFAILIVSFPRVYFGLHYPTDILAGVALGALFGYCMNGMAVRRHFFSRVLLWERRSPPAFYVAMFIIALQFATMFNALRQGAQAAFGVGGRLLAAALANVSGH